jgi:O-6-methylguanine DNA methyltransferase
MPSDSMDDLLTRYFSPETRTSDIAQRVLNGVREDLAGRDRLPKHFLVGASPLGVTHVEPDRPGRAAVVARAVAASGTAARRLAEQATHELEEYVAGARVFFTVPVDLSSIPPFQRRVLDEACGIPFGEVRQYGYLAKRVGHPGAARAVGTALGRNPVPFIVPCHRVLRSGGALGGYAFGLPMKAALLELERSTHLFEGCSSTRIVCRVGCGAARRMRPDHRVVFASVDDARSVGYRPCAVCHPDAAASGEA